MGRLTRILPNLARSKSGAVPTNVPQQFGLIVPNNETQMLTLPKSAQSQKIIVHLMETQKTKEKIVDCIKIKNIRRVFNPLTMSCN